MHRRDQTQTYIANALAGQHDGSVLPRAVRRDTVIYGTLARECPDVKGHLELRLAQHRQKPPSGGRS